MKLKGGVLISNPCPKELSMSHEKIDKLIDQAIDEADKAHIKGKDTTPFLLKRIVELTGGDSLETNIALVINNAKLGAKIAAEYAKEAK